MRNEPRVEILDNKVSVRLESKSEFLTTQARNISRGGVFVESAETLPVGTQVGFAFRFSESGQPFEGIGQVAWVRNPAAGKGPGGMGIRFIRLTGRSREMATGIIELLSRYGEKFEEKIQTDTPGRQRIMVVDDSEFIREWSREVLERAGFEVSLQDSIWIGPTVAREEPDLVLMDVGMGDQDGAQAVADIRQVTGKTRTRFVLYSVKDLEELRQLQQQHGADGAIHKSNDPEELITEVKKLLG